jgi:hypothetical protein
LGCAVEESVRDGPTQTQASSEWSGARDALRLDRLGQEIRTVGLFAAALSSWNLANRASSPVCEAEDILAINRKGAAIGVDRRVVGE